MAPHFYKPCIFKLLFRSMHFQWCTGPSVDRWIATPSPLLTSVTSYANYSCLPLDLQGVAREPTLFSLWLVGVSNRAVILRRDLFRVQSSSSLLFDFGVSSQCTAYDNPDGLCDISRASLINWRVVLWLWGCLTHAIGFCLIEGLHVSVAYLKILFNH